MSVSADKDTGILKIATKENSNVASMSAEVEKNTTQTPVEMGTNLDTPVKPTSSSDAVDLASAKSATPSSHKPGKSPKHQDRRRSKSKSRSPECEDVGRKTKNGPAIEKSPADSSHPPLEICYDQKKEQQPLHNGDVSHQIAPSHGQKIQGRDKQQQKQQQPQHIGQNIVCPNQPKHDQNRGLIAPEALSHQKPQPLPLQHQVIQKNGAVPIQTKDQEQQHILVIKNDAVSKQEQHQLGKNGAVPKQHDDHQQHESVKDGGVPKQPKDSQEQQELVKNDAVAKQQKDHQQQLLKNDAVSKQQKDHLHQLVKHDVVPTQQKDQQKLIKSDAAPKQQKDHPPQLLKNDAVPKQQKEHHQLIKNGEALRPQKDHHHHHHHGPSKLQQQLSPTHKSAPQLSKHQERKERHHHHYQQQQKKPSPSKHRHSEIKSPRQKRHHSEKARSKSGEAQNGIPSDLTCAVCQKKFVDPRLLSCLHTFCAECVNGFITYRSGCGGSSPPVEDRESRTSMNSSLSASSINSSLSNPPKSPKRRNRSVLCPVCDSEVEAKKDGATLLPVNYLIQKKLEKEKLEEIPPCPKCDLCLEEREACGKCIDCNDNLCRVCAEAHKRQRKTIAHTVLDYSQIGENGISQDKRYRICPIHTSEELKLFCESCDQLACRECLLTQHKGHEYGFILEVREKQLKVIQNLLKQTKPQIEGVKEKLQSVQIMSDKIKDRTATLQTDVNLFYDAYIDAVNRHRENIMLQVQELCTLKEKNLNVQKIQLEQALEDFEHSCKFILQTLREGSEHEILSLKPCMVRRLRELNGVRYKLGPSVDDFLKFCPQEKGGVIGEYTLMGNISTQQVDSSQCVLKGEGVPSCRQSHQMELVVVTKDKEGQPMRKGGEEVTATLIQNSDPQIAVAVNAVDKEDGTYLLQVRPEHSGMHILHVMVNSHQIQGSPWTMGVKPASRPHLGSYHCCTFCSSGGRKDIKCGCGASMPGGYSGCGHGHPGHPGRKHWSCCGKVAEVSECSRPPSKIHQITL